MCNFFFFYFTHMETSWKIYSLLIHFSSPSPSAAHKFFYFFLLSLYAISLPRRSIYGRLNEKYLRERRKFLKVNAMCLIIKDRFFPYSGSQKKNFFGSIERVNQLKSLPHDFNAAKKQSIEPVTRKKRSFSPFALNRDFTQPEREWDTCDGINFIIIFAVWPKPSQRAKKRELGSCRICNKSLNFFFDDFQFRLASKKDQVREREKKIDDLEHWKLKYFFSGSLRR